MFQRDKLSYRGRECTAWWVSLDPHLLRSRERALLMPVAQEMDVGADSLQRGSWGEITGLPRFPGHLPSTTWQ